MTLRLDSTSAAKIAGMHDDAATTIDGSAGSMPGNVDGGLGTPYLSDILAAVATTAGELAAVNQAVAGQVRDVVDDMGLTESAVAGQFEAMNEDLE